MIYNNIPTLGPTLPPDRDLVTIKYHNDFILWAKECRGADTIIVGVVE